jgi:hypothetical protein
MANDCSESSVIERYGRNPRWMNDSCGISLGQMQTPSPKRMHLDVVKLTPSKNGNQIIHKAPQLEHLNLNTSTRTRQLEHLDSQFPAPHIYKRLTSPPPHTHTPPYTYEHFTPFQPLHLENVSPTVGSNRIPCKCYCSATK